MCLPGFEVYHAIRMSKKNGNFGNINLFFCQKNICLKTNVDKLSNSQKNNFFNFPVDKTLTIVVYLSTR